MTISTTGKIAMMGAGMLTVLGVAIANNQQQPPSPPPTVSAGIAGMKYMDAANQLDREGFRITEVKFENNRFADNCTTAPPMDVAKVTRVETEGYAAVVYVTDTRVCAPPAPVVMPAPNVNVPRVNAPNVNVPSYRGGGGGESRFCRRRWWC